MSRFAYGQWYRQWAAARCAQSNYQDTRDGDECPGCRRMHPDLPIMPRYGWLLP